MDDRTRRGSERPTILVTTRTFDDTAAAFLTRNGCIVRRSGLPDTVQDSALSPERIRDLLRGVSGWIVGVYPVIRQLMVGFPALKSSRDAGSGTTRSKSTQHAVSNGSSPSQLAAIRKDPLPSHRVVVGQ